VVSTQLTELVTSGKNEIAGGPQASVAVTEPGLGAGTGALQARVTLGGQIIPGGVVSTTLMIACAVVVQPFKSVTVTV
jgi:hypothetical protein